jgi:hypothetical protein
MTDDERNMLGEGDRLRLTGSDVEKWLLRSAKPDGGVNGAEARLFAALAEDGMRGPAQIVSMPPRARSRVRSMALAGLASAAAAAFLIATVRPHAAAPVDSGLAAEPHHGPTPPSPRLSPPTREEPADPGLANCANPVVAGGEMPLIDDFEDANARIAPNEGRSGAWMVYNDGTGTQKPAHGALWHPALIPGGRGTSRYALHTSGGVFKKWGITGGFGLATPSCYDASVYDGVKFWAKGPGRIVFTAKMTQVVALEDGGSCRDNCYDVHRKSIVLTKRWTEYTVKWDELVQLGVGERVPFDPRSLHAMGFFVDGEDTPFDFWIDDLGFLPKR